MKAVIILIIFICQLSSLYATRVEITDKLKTRETIYTTFSDIIYDLTDVNRKRALDFWIENARNKNPRYVFGSYNELKKVIKNKHIVNLLIHYYATNSDKFAKLLAFYVYAVGNFLSDYVDNPTVKSRKYKQGALAILKDGTYSEGVTNILKCAKRYNQGIRNLDGLKRAKRDCIDNNRKIYEALNFTRSLMQEKYQDKYFGPLFLKSLAGYIDGNSVELLPHGPHDPDTILSLGKLAYKFRNHKVLYRSKSLTEMSINDFKSIMRSKRDALKILNDQCGVPEQHPIFHKYLGNNKKNHFTEIYNSIVQAKESIFIDIFFLGGTMGMSLAKLLIQKVQTNPKLKVYILTDRENPLGYRDELNPVYNYLRAYSEKFPEDRIVILPANIFLKRTSLPQFADILLDDQALSTILKHSALRHYKEKITIYPKAKSDHSKVIVIDGKNSDRGLAIIGSKNLTDSSGALAYDEIISIQGPAVKFILDSYYYDLVEAMKLDLNNNRGSYLNNIYQAWFNKKSYQNEIMIKNLLHDIDILERRKSDYMSSTRVFAKTKGNTLMQLGQNNVYGNIRSPLSQNIEAILSAEK
jgi:hypothetical protein